MMLDGDGDTITHGLWRRMFEDCVTWQPAWLCNDDTVAYWLYAVFRYPTVPGFHVCYMGTPDDGSDDYLEDGEVVLSTHKTLHEAMGVCKVLLANGGVGYV